MDPKDIRLIEVAFPLKQTSLDSVHEKMCHSGHIKAIHIWPARRPLAASRAALIATLLKDPGTLDERKELLQKLGGTIAQAVKRKKMPSGKIEEKVNEETLGGILHWGREASPDLEWFRQKIRETYVGRPPQVLDPFSGGGAIPLEAMRLGCEVTAVDINPVAWFILKATLEYPQKLAGQKRRLPAFILKDGEFMESFFKAQGLKGTLLRTQMERLGLAENLVPTLEGLDTHQATLDADLSWHVRAWGRWVLDGARRDLEEYYPSIKGHRSIAYLWARTVKCKNCRATVPLLKSRWIRHKDDHRVLLVLKNKADKSGVDFEIETDVPTKGDNAAKRREHDKRLGFATMTRTGATCPNCGTIMAMEDIRLEGQAGRIGMEMTAVVVEGKKGKEYRSPTRKDREVAAKAVTCLPNVFAEIPFGLPNESTPVGGGGGAGRAFSLQSYGLMHWGDLFTSRQLLTLGTLVKYTRSISAVARAEGYSSDWIEALQIYLACVIDKVADYNTSLVQWQPPGGKGGHTFTRWALPMTWDFVENNILDSDSGGWLAVTDWVADPIGHALPLATRNAPKPTVIKTSALALVSGDFDVIVTDPPYYDAIPYSDSMDFFYVWLRRTLHGLSPVFDQAFQNATGPKWDRDKNDGELIDDESRHDNDAAKSKAVYEDGMARAFQACYRALRPEGRFVIVFAHKQPDAWETLVSAIIRAGFVVDASWPIQTEMTNRSRSLTGAALSSSVWLVCKKRPEAARPGWDNLILKEMEEKIAVKLREFWDAGIRGPDFVWAATGPALEAYSKYPAVKKANEPGQLMTVSEFLGHVRRIVVDFVVGRVLSHNGGSEAVTGLDEVTTYYLLHRHDFGMNDAPAGTSILYAISCGLSDRALTDQVDLLTRTGGHNASEEEETETEETDAEPEEGSGSTVKLKPWNQRKRKNMGYEGAGIRTVPLIDQVHRLMHLWKSGDVGEVDEYLNERGLRRNVLFQQLLQALIELSPAASEERSMLESISNHLAVRGVASQHALPNP